MGTASLAEIIMNKMIYSFILLFSIAAFSQDYKFAFSSRFPVTVDSKGDYIRGTEEKAEGLFFFGLTTVEFELKGTPAEKFTIYKTGYDDKHTDLYDLATIYSFQNANGNFEIILYQFLDRKIQVFCSYEGKKYLYIIDKAIAEDGTVYAVKTK